MRSVNATVVELHDTHSQHDDEDVLVMMRQCKRKWWNDDPADLRSVTYDRFGSLKSGRNQALC